MPGDAIEIEGSIVEALPNTMFRVELSNGHRLLAHLRRELRDGSNEMPAAGGRVTVMLSPYDMSRGRIIAVHGTVAQQQI